MPLRIVNLYRDIPEMLERTEKNKRLIRKKMLHDTVMKRLNQKDLYYKENMRADFVSIIADSMNLEKADSHSTRHAVQQIDNFKIEPKIQELYNRCKEFIPEDLTVYISLGNPKHKYRRMNRGVTGKALHKRNIMLFIWPEPRWHEFILRVVVKQFAKVARMEKIREDTLMENVISEGLAESIVLEVLGIPNKMRVPSEMKLWNIYKENMNVTSRKKIHRLVFGDGEKIPLLAGTFMGYRIVQNYLQKTGKEAHEILRVSAKEILEESDYKNR